MANKSKKSICFFDFDGTITRGDSFLHFILYFCGWWKTVAAGIALSPLIFGYLLGLVSNEKAKQKIFALLFSGYPEKEFREKANTFSRETLSKLVKPSALERILWHKQQNHRVVVVSASLEDYLRGWCESIGVELIATRIEILNGQITGRFATPNCYGSEKVRRIKEIIRLEDYDYVFAYGDSAGDNEMLALADEKFYQFFK